MKKLSLFIAGLFLLAATSPQAGAQDLQSDFFVGDWNVTISDTPDGDASFVLSIARDEEKNLGGSVMMDGAPLGNIYNVTEKENSITALFFAGGFELEILLEKESDNSIKGITAGMFVTSGVRVIEDCGC